jgi:two-component system NtrC family response regulator
MDKEKLLVVEDDDELRAQMKWALGKEYQVYLAADRAGALEVFREEQPAVVTLDLGLPPSPSGVEEGLWVLDSMLDVDPDTKVIVITARNEKKYALDAIARGAYDFLTKPVELEELQIVLKRASYLARLERENKAFLSQCRSPVFEEMIGDSPQMKTVFDIIQRVATSEIPVLIVGESGTGKELTARAIHARSGRREGPLVAINCGAIPENLLEAELFGHEKGAFTGAHIQRMGRMEKAQGGTLFLDEIGEISTHLQSKLLRFLQEQKIERVGGREEILVDARILAATNVDLRQALEKRAFREDLYYRLGVVVVPLPPLREREGDIPLLANVMLKRFSKENSKNGLCFTPQALQAMERHTWPGNIRELENRVKRAVIMARGDKVTPADLELASSFVKYKGLGLREAREALEKDFITLAMARNKGNLTRTASDLGISRPSLYDLMEKLKIERDQRSRIK